MSDNTPLTVDGKTAVVIGGTSGIGEAIATGFAADGADVVATSRTEDAVRQTAAKLREAGARTTEQVCDVTDRASVDSFRDTVFDEFGGVDVLVNSAGIAAREEFLDLSEEDWGRVLDVQLSGVFRVCQSFAGEMDGGSIINISSMSADLGRTRLLPYCAAKSGVNALTRCVAKELGPDIRVNAIAPGFIETPMTSEEYAEGTQFRERIQERTSLARMGKPEEIVSVAIYFASDSSSYTTGEVHTVDGGFTRNAL